MAARIWLARSLCVNKPYHRVMTSECCSSLGSLTPQSVEDGQAFFLRLDWMRYGLSHGQQAFNGVQPSPTPAGPCDWCPSPLNLDSSTVVFDSESDCKQFDTHDRFSTLLQDAAKEWSNSNASNVDDGFEVVSMRNAIQGSVIRMLQDIAKECLDSNASNVDDGFEVVSVRNAIQGSIIRMLQDAAKECSESNASNVDDGFEVVSVRSAIQGSIIRKSSGLGGILSNARRRTSSSVGLTFKRFFCSSDARTDNESSDSEEKKLNPFVVVQGDNESLLRQIDATIEDKKHDFTLDAMKERYKRHVRPQLSCRGLILPDNLKHASTKFVHFRTQEIFGRRPMYMTSLDAMWHEKRMNQEEWQSFLEYMMRARIYVIEKWDSSLSHVESLMYDHGIIPPDDGTNVEFYKAECDASYDENTKEATLGFLIFKGTGIIHCQAHHGLPCESSVMAEAYAAAAVLMTANDLGIRKLVLWTDSTATHEVLSGQRNPKFEDKHLGLFMMLREKKKDFDRVISMWKGREVNQFADELATWDKEKTLSHTFPIEAMQRWKHHLKGSPVFRFKQKNEVNEVVKNFVDNQSFGRGLPKSAVMLDVEKVCKVDCLLGLQDGFKPDDIYVVVHEFSKKPHDLKLKIAQFFGKPLEFFDNSGPDAAACATFFQKVNLRNKKQVGRKSMVVLFDACLWGRSFHTSDLTVVLTSPGDAESSARRNLRKLTAVDYVSFSQI